MVDAERGFGAGVAGKGRGGEGKEGSAERGLRACTFGSASVTVENKRRKYFISLNVVHRYGRTLGGLFTRVKMTFKDLM